jgi:hypothetical protein
MTKYTILTAVAVFAFVSSHQANAAADISCTSKETGGGAAKWDGNNLTCAKGTVKNCNAGKMASKTNWKASGSNFLCTPGMMTSCVITSC